ncbi:hypothetical protein [Flavobacterium sp.]|uniref:hypothetical protein n=1 Tax=Flavobacterium sp. TaxID=239 RepID=UPI0039E3790C
MENTSIVYIVIGIAFFVLTFLLMREVFLWYYKIPLRIDLQIETNKHLKKLTEQNEILINQFKKNEIINKS